MHAPNTPQFYYILPLSVFAVIEVTNKKIRFYVFFLQKCRMYRSLAGAELVLRLSKSIAETEAAEQSMCTKRPPIIAAGKRTSYIKKVVVSTV